MKISISISGRVLSVMLKDLEQQGIVIRKVYSETPVRIEYSLSDKEYALAPVLQEIENWAEHWVESDDTGKAK
ncbi:winged helix-turn-helix transcriptional regulator [Bacillus sp. es.036]|uniref:winged helix-turn-helix transcriptional regulator n=1 Tax=Bacillus sp. es.036 TaxID=1761764 RepID=UPI0027BA80D1|nr:winged helix-turn-helix transcriptional regulator [Bacillus sp. es.036]